ncbi:MAG TPA: malonyl-ACP O-methyltransferase BioC [Gammaproteobacteria bacterium]|nr:malonyl-ACP O-methyltransferase BioC [Gammaproteobacteria bacterium]
MSDAANRDARRAAFERAAAGYERAAVLQAEVQERLLERLELTTIAPRRILDLGAGTGRALGPLARHYPGAAVFAADFAVAMLARARRRGRWFRHFPAAAARAETLPFARGSFDLVFSNLMLQWCPDLENVFSEARRILSDRALLLFATLGPDTLRELRDAWAEVDEHAHVNRFIDMHDLGDALIRAGFVEPVMDVEEITLTYDQVHDLLRDLKAIGAHNVHADRATGLGGPRRFAAFERAYERFRSDGRLPATYEVVYGTAWTPIDLPRR